jgi:hypothetical protein
MTLVEPSATGFVALAQRAVKHVRCPASSGSCCLAVLAAGGVWTVEGRIVVTGSSRSLYR